MEEITIPQHDYGFDIDAKLQTYSGDPFDLSGYAVTAKVWSPSVPETTLLSAACTVVNATSGSVTWTVLSGNFCSNDQYYAEFVATMSGVQETFGTFTIQVAESTKGLLG